MCNKINAFDLPNAMKTKISFIPTGSTKTPFVWSVEARHADLEVNGQELAYGQRMDEMFTATPSMNSVRLVLHHVAQQGKGRRLMSLDVRCAFLYAQAQRSTSSCPVRTSALAPPSLASYARPCMGPESHLSCGERR